ncbi:unnamed protein product, partial [marine sediment metagenome]
MDGKTGFVVDNTQEFTEKLDILISDSKLRLEMGKNGTEYAKKFSWENIVKKYDKVIKNILGLKDSDVLVKKYKDKIKPAKSKRVAVIIVNYNSSYSCLKECLDSIKNQSHKNIEIIIFDNNSTNNVLDSIKKEYRYIKVILSERNLGLGEALNQAIKHTDCEYVLISNFDITYNHDAIEMLVGEIDKLDSLYIGLAPKIKLYYLRDFLESTGIYLDSSYYVGYHGIGQLDLDQYNRPEDIFGVSFTSAFLKKDIFSENKVGKIDPTFFLFYEDVDFCYRANQQGYKFRSCPTAICYHKYAFCFRDDASAFTQKYYYQKLNLLKTIYKNAESHNLKRIMDIELNIQKQNLKDKNLKPIAKKITGDFKKSIRYLKRKRKDIQFSRQVFDTD